MDIKPTAVVTRNLHFCVNWLKDQYPSINYINLSQRTIQTKDGDKFIIVSEYEHAAGLEFSKCIVSPDYYSLEEYVKSRIKI